MTDIEALLLAEDIEYKRDVKLADISSFKIGGEADLFVMPDTPDKLVSSVRAAKKKGVRYAVVGNTSNILFSDDGFRGMIISTKKLCDISFSETDGNLFADCACGAMMPVISAKAAERGYSGFEFACGIPGTIGGAIAMNAGAHGGEISDLLISSYVYDAGEDRCFEISADDHDFSYRHSIFSENGSLICLSTRLAFVRGDKASIVAKIKEFGEKRRATQPLGQPSAGSFFKRPEGYFAAKLIDDCGLKGLRVGNACVSEKHAGFIVNLGGASSADVLSLADKICDEVFAQTGIKLEKEVRLI